jgi:hypothetical protein
MVYKRGIIMSEEINVLGQFEFDSVEMQFEKKPIEEIVELSKKVDTDKAANEILDWLISHVENFIDNKEKEFRIDLVIEENSSEGMENKSLGLETIKMHLKMKILTD